MMTTATLPLRVSRDVIAARELVRRKAQEVGFGLANQTRLAAAVSEITRNAIVHGGGGEMTVDAEANNTRRVTVVIADRGPGIADIELAMTDGWSSAGSLGAGLPGARRLVHSFHIESRPGRGTTVTMGMTE
ncbi:MAG: anti-sigma regulatory factor [Anaerolineae bacterium]